MFNRIAVLCIVLLCGAAAGADVKCQTEKARVFPLTVNMTACAGSRVDRSGLCRTRAADRERKADFPLTMDATLAMPAIEPGFRGPVVHARR
jgi:hypothetical protein